MFYQKFGLKDNPFTINPNPKFLLLTENHGEVLGNLIYTLNHDGITVVTGEVGTGKTTLLRAFFEQVPAHLHLIYIVNQIVTPEELLLSICEELQIQIPNSKSNSVKLMVSEINNVLLKLNSEGKKAILIIDEAQNLSINCIESIRILTNLEKNDSKLLNIILVGQQELNETLKKKEMRQVKSRVTSNNFLYPLNLVETKNYITYRVNTAGGNYSLFDDKSIKLIYKAAEGIPRMINIICEKALIIAYSQENTKTNTQIVKKAIHLVTKELNPNPKNRTLVLTPLVLILFILTSSLYLYLFQPQFTQQIAQDYLGINQDNKLKTSVDNTSVKLDVPQIIKNQKTNIDNPTFLKTNNLTSNNLGIKPTKLSITTNSTTDIPVTMLFNEVSKLSLDKKNIIKVLDNINLRKITLNPNKSLCENIENHGYQCFPLKYNFKQWYKNQFFSIIQLKNEKFLVIDKFIAKNSLEYFYIQYNWDSKIIAFMQAPSGFNHLVKIDDYGENVKWVYDQIESLPIDRNKYKNIQNPYHYDKDFETVVKNVQQIIKASPDGDFGVETLFKLNIYKNNIHLYSEQTN